MLREGHTLEVPIGYEIAPNDPRLRANNPRISISVTAHKFDERLFGAAERHREVRLRPEDPYNPGEVHIVIEPIRAGDQGTAKFEIEVLPTPGVQEPELLFVRIDSYFCEDAGPNSIQVLLTE